MLKDKIGEKLKEGTDVIDLRGSITPISTCPEIEAYGFVKITNFSGLTISSNTPVSNNMEIRMCASLSGSTVIKVDGSYDQIYLLDNCHPNEGLHEHIGQEKIKIKEETVGDVISRFFKKVSLILSKNR